jgi:hypothetical protein
MDIRIFQAVQVHVSGSCQPINPLDHDKSLAGRIGLLLAQDKARLASQGKPAPTLWEAATLNAPA